MGGLLWVYGSAFFEGGNSVQVNAYQNLNVREVDGQLVGQLEAELWGELSVESLSCDQLSFRYRPLNDGSGDARNLLLTRLTNSSVADCAD
jgi:hypothetical protein